MRPPGGNKPIRVLLVDDHAVVRQGFRLILGQHPDIVVVGEAADGYQGIEQTRLLEPNVVVMDIAMPGLNGVEATRQIRREHPECRVLVLSMHKDAPYVRETLRAGAKGYLLKDSIDSDLVTAVRAVARGEAFLSPGVSATVLADYEKHVSDPIDLITPRERQLLQMLAEGKTSKDIATELNISVYTVDAHRSRIMKKLQLRSIGDLVRFAIQRGMVPLSGEPESEN
ncbi:MAG: response regulator transcription factor [Acidobacteria bacterium]|nr:response regulator transcription factor [Acidobacteriota bacterium]